MNTYYTVGRQIARARDERGWTQTDLADALEVSQGTVSRWESGEQAISLLALTKVAGLLGVPVRELMP